ncbi:hypothetical protein U1769_05020 [Sphingomonas sp. ZT3P38]|uniref:hypothetical protein n=1 Tax=Parasphingomonas zepuensis TaxID=3096161 RepID=UPI002FCAEBDA
MGRKPPNVVPNDPLEAQMSNTDGAWGLSQEWLEHWRHFKVAFYKWVPDKPRLSAGSRAALPDRRDIFADAMGVGRGDIGVLDYPDWLSWDPRTSKAHQRHPQTVLGHIIKALRSDKLPDKCGQDEHFDESWAIAESNRLWLADEGERQLEAFRSRHRQSMPPAPPNRSGGPIAKKEGEAIWSASDDVELSPHGVRVASFAALLRSGFSADEVIEGIEKVFEALVPMPDTLPGNDVGNSDKWEALIREFPYCVFLLLDGRRICGYWMVLPVTTDLYSAGIDGRNINKSISVLDTEEIDTPGTYQLYFVDLFILPEYRGANTVMLRSFVAFLLGLSRNGIFVRRIFANISSSPAQKTCAKIGFRFVKDHCEHLSVKFSEDGSPHPTKIYELDLSSSDDVWLWHYGSELAHIYRTAFVDHPSV